MKMKTKSKCKTTVQCTYCSQSFHNGLMLLEHALQHLAEPKDDKTCDECGVRFPSDDKLYTHLVNHVLTNPLACHACYQILPSIEALEQHLLDHIYA